MWRWWSCKVYYDELPPTPSATGERDCEVLRQWVPRRPGYPNRLPERPMTAVGER